MWNAARSVEREWLDELPAADPRAVRSRNDLQRVNAWMLQGAIMARSLMAACGERTPRTLLDLGSGDGRFLLRVARRLPWRDVNVILLDRQNIVSGETLQQFRALRWNVEAVAADAFEFLDRGAASDVDFMTANLFLHHFPDRALKLLLALASRRSRVFVACEPRRAMLALRASHLLWVLGCNDVTRHDAAVSVRAGFRDRELSAAWPKDAGWELREHPAMLFSHCFAARRLERAL